ncbi:MAG: DUF3467 domain-containing protein [Betaproteobacteria bacterium]
MSVKKNDRRDTVQMEKAASIKSPHFRIIYSNNLRAGISDWDIQLTFGRLEEVEIGKVAPVDYAHIMMSPGFAKAVSLNLVETIRQYELRFGAIPAPKVAQPKS